MRFNKKAEGRGQMAEGTVSRRFKPLVNEDHQASLDGGIKQGNKGKGDLNPLPSACMRTHECPLRPLASGAKRR